MADLRNRATEMLFKRLTSGDAAMVASAQQGLASVVTDQRSIPKPLLQVPRKAPWIRTAPLWPVPKF